MSLSGISNEISKAVDQYQQLLNSVSETEFQRSPAPGVWSYAEVFSHIFRSNMLMRPVIEKCANGTAIENAAPLKIPYKLVLFFRRYPPTMKFKVPPKLEYLVERVSKAQAQELIDQFRKDLPELISMATKASPTQKVKHPRMGLLNAVQWMMFTELHTKHHARQLGRVGKLLANS
jgi:DinB superfamily